MQFEYVRQIGAILESTSFEIFSNPFVTCPLHGVSFPPAAECEEECEFTRLFKKLFGIDIKDYIKIKLFNE